MTSESRTGAVGARIETIAAFITELERLKLVMRKSYVTDMSRNENSAEHSWHMALGLLTIAHELQLAIDVPKALTMALVHDVCEIDAGDVSVFDPTRNQEAKASHERRCIERLAGCGLKFATDIQALWEEYEAQQTIESRWVRVLDRLMPFIVNLATQGQSWVDQGIARSQVVRINEPVRVLAPEIFDWMMNRLDECVRKGWLRDA